MPNTIEVRELTKKFRRFTAVDHISFDVGEGEIFGFLGPNGAGKSTTIRILTTLLRPTSGEARIAGLDVVRDQAELRQRIGLVAEKLILYNHLTACENLEFFGGLNHMPKELIRERTDRWLERLDMTQWRDKQVGTFSTGMKQRINIARALLTEPDVLFLDEPTLGLDPQTSRLIRDFIRELNGQGTTVVLTTHDMLEAESLSDRVAIIDHGRISAVDTVDNLKKQVKGARNLEDVFLALTGSAVRDMPGRQAASVGGGHWGGGRSGRIR